MCKFSATLGIAARPPNSLPASDLYSASSRRPGPPGLLSFPGQAMARRQQSASRRKSSGQTNHRQISGGLTRLDSTSRFPPEFNYGAGNDWERWNPDLLGPLRSRGD